MSNNSQPLSLPNNNTHKPQPDTTAKLSKTQKDQPASNNIPQNSHDQQPKEGHNSPTKMHQTD
eukprot:198960-Ditylum_brightwellii.AAC.1